MKKKTIISQEWWLNEGDKNIPTDHQSELENEGISRAIEMMKDGYTSGELFCVVDDGTNYNGFWSLTTETE